MMRPLQGYSGCNMTSATTGNAPTAEGGLTAGEDPTTEGGLTAEGAERGSEPDLSAHDTTRRDRKKLATRQALRCAALDLVAERGYAHVTVEDIAEAADVSPRTFFNYFPSKEAALLGDDGELDVLRADILGRPADEDPFAVVEHVVCAHVAAKGRHPDGTWRDPEALLRRMQAVQSDPHLLAALVAHMAAFERVVADAVAERIGVEVTSDPYPALLAASGMAVARVALLYWARAGGAGAPDELARAGFRALSSGLADAAQLRTATATTRAKTSR